MPDPILEVSLLTPEEASQYQAIRHETFKPTINKILYTRQLESSPETMNAVIKDIADGIGKGVMYLKCVDTQTGELIAGARWRYMGKEIDKEGKTKLRDWEDVQKDLVVPEPYSESDERVFQKFFTELNAGKLQHMSNRPYFVLDTLVTHPSHHRRGAGGLLVQWGCTKADEKGVEAYLEASPMGMPLYARYGFVEVGRAGVDLREFGYAGEQGEAFKFILMRRPARERTARNS